MAEPPRFRWASTVRTSLYDGCEHRIVRGMGDFLQLDIGADGLVEALVGWIRHRSLADPGAAAN